MKFNFKALSLVFRPNLVKQALKNLWEIIKYNLDTEKFPDLERVATEYMNQYGILALIKICFDWIVEEVLPRWSRELTEGHALTLAECEWNGVHEE